MADTIERQPIVIQETGVDTAPGISFQLEPSEGEIPSPRNASGDEGKESTNPAIIFPPVGGKDSKEEIKRPGYPVTINESLEPNASDVRRIRDSYEKGEEIPLKY